MTSIGYGSGWSLARYGKSRGATLASTVTVFLSLSTAMPAGALSPAGAASGIRPAASAARRGIERGDGGARPGGAAPPGRQRPPSVPGGCGFVEFLASGGLTPPGGPVTPGAYAPRSPG